MSLRSTDKAKAAVYNMLDFFGDHSTKHTPFPNEERFKAWPAYSIAIAMITAINHEGTDTGAEFEQEWKQRIAILMAKAEGNREAYLSCVVLLELLSEYGIAPPPELTDLATKVMRGELTPPSKRGERYPGRASTEALILVCIHAARHYVDVLHGESSPNTSAIEIVAECLDSRGFKADNGKAVTMEAVKKMYQRFHKKQESFNP